jgi:hypothetical protein
MAASAGSRPKPSRRPRRERGRESIACSRLERAFCRHPGVFDGPRSRVPDLPVVLICNWQPEADMTDGHGHWQHGDGAMLLRGRRYPASAGV